MILMNTTIDVYDIRIIYLFSLLSNSYLSFSSLYHIFLFASMFGEIARVEIRQSKR